jgi:hypothetical protein
MKAKDVLNIIRAYERENLRNELKMVEKFVGSEGSFNHKEMATILVSFANREGGNLIVGVKDSGEFEGAGIFEKFSGNSKSGFDKFKEHIENLCKDIISPQLLVTIQHMRIESNDIAIIGVPKRKSIPHAVIAKHEGTAIRAREYYIRNNHGKALVSDRQLEWLFQYRDAPVVETKHEIAVTLTETLEAIPLQMAPYAFNIQPESSQRILEYLQLLDDDSKVALMKDQHCFHCFLGEIVAYAIIQSQDSRYDKYKAMPLPHDRMWMYQFLGESTRKIIRKHGNLWSVPFGTSIKVKGNGEWTLVKFGNRFAVSTMMLKPCYVKSGLSKDNPLTVSMPVVTFGFDVSIQTTMKFPEFEAEGYEAANVFITALSDHIHENWDIKSHYDQIPHLLKLYDLDAKLDKLLGEK